MRLRAFDPDTEFEIIRGWTEDERAHAMWCANRFHYPLEKDDFLAVLADLAQRTGSKPSGSAPETDIERQKMKAGADVDHAWAFGYNEIRFYWKGST